MPLTLPYVCCCLFAAMNMLMCCVHTQPPCLRCKSYDKNTNHLCIYVEIHDFQLHPFACACFNFFLRPQRAASCLASWLALRLSVAEGAKAVNSPDRYSFGGFVFIHRSQQSRIQGALETRYCVSTFVCLSSRSAQ